MSVASSTTTSSYDTIVHRWFGTTINGRNGIHANVTAVCIDIGELFVNGVGEGSFRDEVYSGGLVMTKRVSMINTGGQRRQRTQG